MIVLIKSEPDTTDGTRGVALALECGADIILLQNGVLFAQKGRLNGFHGAVYVLDDDKKLRGLKDAELVSHAKAIDYDRFVDLITESDKVVGIF